MANVKFAVAFCEVTCVIDVIKIKFISATFGTPSISPTIMFYILILGRDTSCSNKRSTRVRTIKLIFVELPPSLPSDHIIFFFDFIVSLFELLNTIVVSHTIANIRIQDHTTFIACFRVVFTNFSVLSFLVVINFHATTIFTRVRLVLTLMQMLQSLIIGHTNRVFTIMLHLENFFKGTFS